MSPQMLSLLTDATLQTLSMVLVAGALACLGGIPLGLFLALCGPGDLLPRPALQRLLGLVVNATRSTPFIILVVAIVPLTRALTGTSIGTAAATVPLTLAAIPFIARVVEAAVREVDHGLLDAARAMGARPGQIIRLVLLPEARAGILRGLTLAAVNLVGYSAMVGAVGGGGLGDLGIRYGYQRFMPEMMLAVVLILIVLVQILQSGGEALARKLDKRHLKG
ncbi:MULTISPECIES: methionine ABC transporter permease [unclassified Azospirillum]|uniref:methionine ABC transporter permease n=1 Tax=unclassified Azospirillum TaxID=2630922 RepID=UPI000B72453A|nr:MULTISPECIES: methionine ABC transporter permease [unclassified Azospirillum]SNS81587.1 D-methionine transport system permease protein [Azospirillum sp. RU38E]SNS98678.1 D-methionine transport system permease protein [Azospirillum sp. RU37A]